MDEDISFKILGHAIRLTGKSGRSSDEPDYIWIADQSVLYPIASGQGKGAPYGIRLAPLSETPVGAPDWSVFNVIPGLSGVGISLQTGPDSEAYLVYEGGGAAIYYICDRLPRDENKLDAFKKAASFNVRPAKDGNPGSLTLELAHDQPKVISADMKRRAIHPVQALNWSKDDENRIHASFTANTDGIDPGVRVSPKWAEIASFTNPSDTEQKGLTFETTRTVGITNSRGSSSTTQNAWKVALSATGGPVTAMIEASGSVSKTESESVSFTLDKTSKITVQQATVGPHQTIRLWERAVDVETSTVSFSGAEVLALKITYDKEPPPDLGDMGSRLGTETDVPKPTRS